MLGMNQRDDRMMLWKKKKVNVALLLKAMIVHDTPPEFFNPLPFLMIIA